MALPGSLPALPTFVELALPGRRPQDFNLGLSGSPFHAIQPELSGFALALVTVEVAAR